MKKSRFTDSQVFDAFKQAEDTAVLPVRPLEGSAPWLCAPHCPAKLGFYRDYRLAFDNEAHGVANCLADKAAGEGVYVPRLEMIWHTVRDALDRAQPQTRPRGWFRKKRSLTKLCE